MDTTCEKLETVLQKLTPEENQTVLRFACHSCCLRTPWSRSLLKHTRGGRMVANPCGAAFVQFALKTMASKKGLQIGGEGGIRTPGTRCRVQRFSRPPH